MEPLYRRPDDGTPSKSIPLPCAQEMAHDYRYFPDPDLMPVKIDSDWVERVREELPEKPFDKQRRYMEEMNLPYSSTSALCVDRPLCEFFEKTAESVKDLKKGQLGSE